MHGTAASVVEIELLRLAGRLPGLDDTVRAEIAAAVHRVAAGLLPTLAAVDALAAHPAAAPETRSEVPEAVHRNVRFS